MIHTQQLSFTPLHYLGEVMHLSCLLKSPSTPSSQLCEVTVRGNSSNLSSSSGTPVGPQEHGCTCGEVASLSWTTRSALALYLALANVSTEDRFATLRTAGSSPAKSVHQACASAWSFSPPPLTALIETDVTHSTSQATQIGLVRLHHPLTS